ncbi:MAG: hypothetical protein P4L22_06185 [Candidatus Babeliales bacterium]|nr:hypothetical protein [Candidatus Babeliales bacterium]
MKIIKLILFFNILFCLNSIISEQIITNRPVSQVGDSIARFILAKLLSIKYDIPFYYSPFRYSDLFILDIKEKRINNQEIKDFTDIIYADIKDINNVKYKNLDVLLRPHLGVKIQPMNKDWWNLIKKLIRFKNIPNVKPLPKDKITIALHIRKGNGGGEVYDGEQSSLQYFNFNRSDVVYVNNYFNYPFDLAHYQRLENGEIVNAIGPKTKSSVDNDSILSLDKIERYMTKFPPEQYYVDQICKVADELKMHKLFIEIFTDDNNPYALIDRLKKAANRKNIVFYYQDNRKLSFKERIYTDLYKMSLFDGLIRSESYFPRISEIMGNHKFVIFPLDCIWQENKLIMTKIAIKGSISSLNK